MSRIFQALLATGALVLLPTTSGWAEEVSREQIKGLDEQVQDIKQDALGISAELRRLEEKLLYPSNTQVALFVSLDEGADFRLDAVDITLDGKEVTHYIYSFKELEALRQGGVQRIYTGNIRSGDHDLKVTMIGKTQTGREYSHTASYKLTKGIGPKLLEMKLAGPGDGSAVAFRDW